MESIVSNYARLMEDTYVDIAGLESSYCVVSPDNGDDYVESCDPPNRAGGSKFDMVWGRGAYTRGDTATLHDDQFQNPSTGTCTRFDKDEDNNFLGSPSSPPRA